MTTLFLALTLAAASSAAPEPKPAAAPVADEKKICRSDTPTGSHFARKICHTRTDWATIDHESAKAATRYNNGGRSNMLMNPIHHDY